jgi:hypothetical protein
VLSAGCWVLSGDSQVACPCIGRAVTRQSGSLNRAQFFEGTPSGQRFVTPTRGDSTLPSDKEIAQT